MGILTRKSAVDKLEENDRRLSRELATATEAERAAADDHAARVRRLENLPEINVARHAGGLELLPVAPLEAEVREAAGALNARAHHRASIARRLKENMRDLKAAIAAERRERYQNAIKEVGVSLAALIDDVTAA